MAELVALHPSYLNALPDGLDTRRGAWVEPLAVAVRAVRTSPIRLGDSAVVLGGGPIGQLVVQLLRRAGVSPIVLVEASSFRAQRGLRSGADEAISPGDAVARLAAGTMLVADHVFECSGSPAAPQLAVEIVAAGGVIRLVGMPPGPVALDTAAAIVKEARLLTGFVYVPDEFALAIRMLAEGVVEMDLLTTDVLPMEAFDDHWRPCVNRTAR